MMKYVVCGSSVEDVEAGVQAMKLAIASGARCGVGGSTMAEVEKNLDAMKQMVGGNAVPSHPSYDCGNCPSPCSGCCECEDEDEDIGYEEGYMALTNDGEELSDLCDSPEEAMAEGIGKVIEEGRSLGDIGIYEVRVYDDECVEVIDTIHRPIK